MDFTTDDNIFIEYPENITLVTFDQVEKYDLIITNRTEILPSVGNIISKIYIRSSPIYINFDSSYQKLSSFLANFGGIMSNFLLLL